jgi:hypothetical protein
VHSIRLSPLYSAAGLDIDCDGGNNDDLPEQDPEISEASQDPSGNAIIFNFNIMQYDYSSDACTNCDAPPGAVENVRSVPTGPAVKTVSFSCGEN